MLGQCQFHSVRPGPPRTKTLPARNRTRTRFGMPESVTSCPLSANVPLKFSSAISEGGEEEVPLPRETVTSPRIRPTERPVASWTLA